VPERWSDRAIFDPMGNVTEYQSVGRDITEMKEAEETLWEREIHLTNAMKILLH
jgi:hypothetical protein